MLFKQKVKEFLKILYSGEEYDISVMLMDTLYQKWKMHKGTMEKPLSEKDCMLITYGDGIWEKGEPSLQTLRKFLNQHCAEEITNVHLLPVFPYTSDDGFSVSDYTCIRPELGDWDDLNELGKNVGIMMDAVINHSSKSHKWFQQCLEGVDPYQNYYIACDESLDYSKVTRPRALPLLTPFRTTNGEKWYWTTFSDDQIDLNFASPYLLKEVVEILFQYANKGARFIRLDAIGFAWKEQGTTCMHLQETHALIKLMRLMLDELFPGTYIITETNVPHSDNISYFGDGDEAHMVYQFPLPPLVLYTMLSGNTSRIRSWSRSLQETPIHEGCTFFNFLASHDGIGVRPVDGILQAEEKQLLLDRVLQHGGRISYKQDPDGSESPYELNINYLDAVTSPAEKDEEIRIARFLAAQAIMLSLQGVPGIYYHSLLGSGNWDQGMEESGIPRKINRQKLMLSDLDKELQEEKTLRSRVFRKYLHLLRVRGRQSAFSPEAEQKIMDYGDAVFALERDNKKTGQRVAAFINVTGEEVALENEVCGKDIVEGQNVTAIKTLKPYQVLWIAK